MTNSVLWNGKNITSQILNSKTIPSTGTHRYATHNFRGFIDSDLNVSPFEKYENNAPNSGVRIISLQSGHNDVVELFKSVTTTDPATYAGQLIHFEEQSENFTIEFFVYHTNTYWLFVGFRDASDGQLVDIRVTESTLFAYYNKTNFYSPSYTHYNSWVLWRFDFNMSAQTFDFYIGGSQIVSNGTWRTDPQTGRAVEYMSFAGGNYPSTLSSFMNVVGITSKGYAIGENLSPAIAKINGRVFD